MTGVDFLEPGRVFLEALRLDQDPLESVRSRAFKALEHGVGGFVLFGGEAESVARLTADLRAEAGRPLWFAADLERGAGQQFEGLPTLPPPAALARHPAPEQAVRLAAGQTARDARSVGINWALAPVLDLDIEPANPIVGTRSFGSDPELVARLGAAWIEACQAGGVAACAKHFPGHGRTTGDSHSELPSVDSPREELEDDLVPFRAVASEVATVMSAHVAYPGLGSSGPATLSPAILGALLRSELGFEGLVVSDALNMAGFSGASPAAALLAGCDLLLYPADLETAVRGLGAAARRAEPVARRLEDAAARSSRQLARFSGLGPDSQAAPQTDHDAAPPVRAFSPDLDRLALECVAEVGAPERQILNPGLPLEVCAVWDDREEPRRPAWGAEFRAALTEAGWTVRGPEADTDLGAEGRAFDPAEPTQRVVLVAATPQAWKGRPGLSDDAAAEVGRLLDTGVAASAADAADGAEGSPTYPIMFGHMRTLESIVAPGAPGACAWSSELSAERAAALWLDQRVRN
ncbi:MAG: glycoside hydrolase family 3 N-terminal domain-containing protein [Gemmatimonadota bacterium]